MRNGTVVFLRDDDVDQLNDQLVEFVELFLSLRIPVNYQVTPGRLQDDAANYILAKRRESPALIRLNQHGYLHEQVIDGRHYWSEFSGGRPYEDQLEAIGRGQQILKDSFGSSFDDRVFTPPAHKYDESTLRALEDHGFEIVSGSFHHSALARLFYRVGQTLGRVTLLNQRVSFHGTRLPNHRLTDVSISIDVDMVPGRDGKLVVKPVSQLMREFRRAARATSVVGIMLHHNVYDHHKFEILRDFMTQLMTVPDVSFSLIEDIADDIGRRPIARS